MKQMARPRTENKAKERRMRQVSQGILKAQNGVS